MSQYVAFESSWMQNDKIINGDIRTQIQLRIEITWCKSRARNNTHIQDAWEQQNNEIKPHGRGALVGQGKCGMIK
jgi:hypothetical protein